MNSVTEFHPHVAEQVRVRQLCERQPVDRLVDEQLKPMTLNFVSLINAQVKCSIPIVMQQFSTAVTLTLSSLTTRSNVRNSTLLV